jgi:hypothetical protein
VVIQARRQFQPDFPCVQANSQRHRQHDGLFSACHQRWLAKPGIFEQASQVIGYGYEVLKQVEAARRTKPAAKGDRFSTLIYGQGLRLGQCALVSACVGFARTAGEEPGPGLQKVLMQWPSFEKWASGLKANKAYKLGGAFDFTNYYKGATVGQDIQNFPFVF